ncbi:chaplin [Streptomyces sp. E2N166]|uniref:chaplin n=1 Tax=Streptomyces sp. E2N166 TaxID=1851909 RepID=UPI000EF6B292|nr:chaplin [Streptomyces sp. E2N166]
MTSRVIKYAGLLAAVGALGFGGAASASADSGAQGAAVGSPGVASGNVIQVPVSVPVNACGNTVNVIGLLNPAFGNTCVNGGGHGEWGMWR